MAEIKTERLDGYRRLIEIARDLASTLDLDVLLEQIVQAAAEVSGSEAASILLYDDVTQQLYFQVATNLDEPTMRGLVIPLEGSIAGWIVTNRKPIRNHQRSGRPAPFCKCGPNHRTSHQVFAWCSAHHQKQNRGCVGSAE